MKAHSCRFSLIQIVSPGDIIKIRKFSEHGNVCLWKYFFYKIKKKMSINNLYKICEIKVNSDLFTNLKESGPCTKI